MTSAAILVLLLSSPLAVPAGAVGRVPAEPLSAPRGAGRLDWGTDVEVSDRDSVQQVRLDVHAGTGNLFCVTRLTGDGYPGSWTANFSSDGGLSWTETFLWWATYPVPAVAAACLGEYCYVLMPRFHDHSQAVLVRLRSEDGGLADFPNGLSYLMVDSLTEDSVVDCAVASDADGEDHRLFLAIATARHRMRAFRLDTADFAPVAFTGLPSDARGGIDWCYNDGFSRYPHFVSYLDTSGQAVVLGIDTAGRTDVLLPGRPSAGSYTSIAAWRGNVIITYDGAGSRRVARAGVSFDEGTTWISDAIGDTFPEETRSADVTARRGDGFGAAYWQEPEESGASWVWRDHNGDWRPPRIVQDAPADSSRLPAAAWLEQGVHGIAYITLEDGGRVMFDRSFAPGVCDEARRFRPRRAGGSVVRRVLRLEAGGAARLVDASGRVVRELGPGQSDVAGLPPGVYFVCRDGVRPDRVVLVR